MDPITEKYTQINHIIKDIEELFIKTYIFEYNSIDLDDDYTDYQSPLLNPDVSDPISQHFKRINMCKETLEFLTTIRDQNVISLVWQSDKEFIMNSNASTDNVSELFDEFIFILNETLSSLRTDFDKLNDFSTVTIEKLQYNYSLIAEDIKTIKYFVKDIYETQHERRYYEAMCYIKKTEELLYYMKITDNEVDLVKKYYTFSDQNNPNGMTEVDIVSCYKTCYDELLELESKTRYKRSVSELNESSRNYEIIKKNYITKAYTNIENVRSKNINYWKILLRITNKLSDKIRCIVKYNTIKNEDWRSIIILFEKLIKRVEDNKSNSLAKTFVVGAIYSDIMDIISKYMIQIWYGIADTRDKNQEEFFITLSTIYIIPAQKLIIDHIKNNDE